jgi:hypothetical protein
MPGEFSLPPLHSSAERDEADPDAGAYAVNTDRYMLVKPVCLRRRGALLTHARAGGRRAH